MTGVRPRPASLGSAGYVSGGERRASHFDAYTRALTESNTYAVSVIPASRRRFEGTRISAREQLDLSLRSARAHHPSMLSFSINS